MTTLKLTPRQMAFKMIFEIMQDMDNGWIPYSVGTFADLHEYCDANEYLIHAMEEVAEDYDPADAAQADRDNKAMDIVNCWLAVR